MKVTLDLDKLLSEKKITQIEYEKLKELAAKSTSSLAFNALIGFGVVAVSGATLALVPESITALGFLILIAGLVLLRCGLEQWKILSNIFILVGSLMTGGGIVTESNGSFFSFLSVTVIFSIAAIFARSTLLAVLATLMLSFSIGVATNGSYSLAIYKPTITIILFSLLSIGFYKFSKRLPVEYERLVLASAKAGIFLVNFGFWHGTFGGERTSTGEEVLIPGIVFSVVWALALLVTAIWSWRQNRRWVLNTVVTFAGIHFYTQWFYCLNATPGSVLVAGLLALAFAVGIRSFNLKMQKNI